MIVEVPERCRNPAPASNASIFAGGWTKARKARPRSLRTRFSTAKATPHKPAIVRIGQCQQKFRVIGRVLQQGVECGIAADYSIQSDQFGRRDFGSDRHEVGRSPGDTRCEASAQCLCLATFGEGWRHVNAGRLGHTSLEELERQRADAGSDVQHAAGPQARGGEPLKQSASGPAGAVGMIGGEVSRGARGAEVVRRRIAQRRTALTHDSGRFGCHREMRYASKAKTHHQGAIQASRHLVSSFGRGKRQQGDHHRGYLCLASPLKIH